MSARLSLPDVTICSANSAFVPLTARALNLSMEQCEFGDAILCSDTPADGAFRNVSIPPLQSVSDYSDFCLHVLPDLIKTPFVLVVQWDGYVVNADAWANAFRKYDYIGAPWHGVFDDDDLVGNGGFSLRSQKLLRAAKTLPGLGGFWEDRIICRVFRADLERYAALRFAPVKVADRFAYEFKTPEGTPFGFHGIQHMGRHADDEEFVDVAAAIDLEKANTQRVLALVRYCAFNGLPRAAAVLYGRVRQTFSQFKVEFYLGDEIGPEAAADEVARLETLLAA